jgi:hypothetical protein
MEINWLVGVSDTGNAQRSVGHSAVEERRELSQLRGREELFLSDAPRRVAHVMGRRIFILPAPIWFHCVLAQAFEWTMKVPLVVKAQVRILAEGAVDEAPPCDSLPADLMPSRCFTAEYSQRTSGTESVQHA